MLRVCVCCLTDILFVRLLQQERLQSSRCFLYQSVDDLVKCSTRNLEEEEESVVFTPRAAGLVMLWHTGWDSVDRWHFCTWICKYAIAIFTSDKFSLNASIQYNKEDQDSSMMQLIQLCSSNRVIVMMSSHWLGEVVGPRYQCKGE